VKGGLKIKGGGNKPTPLFGQSRWRYEAGRMVEVGRAKQEVGHILIARPDKAGAAQARLKQMGIDAMTLPAITPTGLSEGMAQVGHVRFGGGTIPRTPASHGAGLSHIAALSMGRAYQWEWVGLWEEDVCGTGTSLQGREDLEGAGLQEGRGSWDGPHLKGGTDQQGRAFKDAPRSKGARVQEVAPQSRGAGFADGPGFDTPPLSRARGLRVGDFWDALEIPPDCGAVYLGGALWGSADFYGEQISECGLWRARALPISCTHALMIHAQAMDDVIASCARMDMTIDDCVSRACIEATTQGKWSTCFVQPWIAWQLDRRETWPRELIEEVEREK